MQTAANVTCYSILFRVFFFLFAHYVIVGYVSSRSSIQPATGRSSCKAFAVLLHIWKHTNAPDLMTMHDNLITEHIITSRSVPYIDMRVVYGWKLETRYISKQPKHTYPQMNYYALHWLSASCRVCSTWRLWKNTNICLSFLSFFRHFFCCIFSF